MFKKNNNNKNPQYSYLAYRVSVLCVIMDYSVGYNINIV